jgi:hypothetical protein|tara:strand:+ start:259 stop:846 length:588 start_codon:yes stop_codon:yes gene_type:complete
MSKENMKLWNAVEKTNPKYTKQVGFGRKFTTVNAQYQVKCATEQFGPLGKGWGIDNEFFHPIIEGLIGYTAKLWWQDSDGKHSFDINASISTHSKSGKLDDECFKKVTTDALTKGLSKLGFNADVFMGQYDDNKYVAQMKKEFSKEEKKKTKMTADIFNLMMEAISKGKGDKVKERMGDYTMTKPQKDKLLKALA